MTVKKKGILDVVLVVGGKGAGIAAIFAGGVIVARLCGKDGYALFVTALNLVMLLDALIGSPMDLAVARQAAIAGPGQAESTARAQVAGLHSKWLFALLALAVSPFFIDSMPGMPWGAAIFVLMAMGAARSSSLQFQVAHRFRAYSAFDLLQGTLRVGAFLALAWFGVTSAPTYLVAFGAVAAVLFVLTPLVTGSSPALGKWPPLAESRVFLRHAGITAGIVAMGSITGRADMVFLATAPNLENMHGYAAASQVSSLFAQFAFSLAVLTQTRVVDAARRGQLGTMVQWNAMGTLGLGLLVGGLWLAFPALPGWGLEKIFGDGFAAAAPLLAIHSVGGVLDVLIVPVLMIYAMQLKPMQTLIGEGVILVGFLVCAWAAARGWFPGQPEQAMAWTVTLARAAKLIFYIGLALPVLFRRPEADVQTCV